METFDGAFRRLNDIISQYPQGSPRKPLGPDMVPVKLITRIPSLFSARTSGRDNDNGGFEEHARDLHRALKGMPSELKQFDPIIVFEVGGKDYCVDGHHRIAAYLAAKVTGKVPVKRIGGTLEEAIAAAIEANSKTVLPMTRLQRHEAAWKLVKIGHGSKEQQAQRSGMGQTFIAELRRLRRKLTETHPEGDWGSLWEAHSLVTDCEPMPEWTEEMEQAEIDEYVRRLKKSFGSKLHRRQAAVVGALASIIGAQGMVDALAQYGDAFGQISLEDLGDEGEQNDDF